MLADAFIASTDSEGITLLDLRWVGFGFPFSLFVLKCLILGEQVVDPSPPKTLAVAPSVWDTIYPSVIHPSARFTWHLWLERDCVEQTSIDWQQSRQYYAALMDPTAIWFWSAPKFLWYFLYLGSIPLSATWGGARWESSNSTRVLNLTNPTCLT